MVEVVVVFADVDDLDSPRTFTYKLTFESMETAMLSLDDFQHYAITSDRMLTDADREIVGE